MITTTFCFPAAAEKESVCIREKYVNLYSTGHDLEASFL